MSEYLLIKLLHVLGLAYWLGGDLGVFYSSFILANDKLSSEVRVSAGKMLFALDQAPRICMTLMLPLGLHLAWKLGALPIDSIQMAFIWIVCLLWLGNVTYLHFGASASSQRILTRIDFWFRVALALSLIACGVAALLSNALVMPYWLAWKLILFGGLVSCGLLVRIYLKDFAAAFANLAQGQATAGDDATIRRSFARVRPVVITIWIGLIASAALGLHLL